MKRIHVVAAVIEGSHERILIAKRPDHLHQGGLWEFPGGKLEQGESARVALERELLEELGIHVTEARPFVCISHDYPDKQVLLDVWWVDGFTGRAASLEGQQIAWVQKAELAGYSFPEANAGIIEKILQ